VGHLAQRLKRVHTVDGDRDTTGPALPLLPPLTYYLSQQRGEFFPVW
jgi:hypothetical protein